MPDDHVSLERYEDYWGERDPRSASSSVRSRRTRRRDCSRCRTATSTDPFDLPISEVDQWEGLDGVTVITAPSIGVYQLILDQEPAVRRHPRPQGDRLRRGPRGPRAGGAERQGRSRPRDQPAGDLGRGARRASVSILRDAPDVPFDLDAARDELAQSVVPDGFEFSVGCPEHGPGPINSFLAIAETLGQIGITMDVQQVDPGDGSTYFAHEDLGAHSWRTSPTTRTPRTTRTSSSRALMPSSTG